MSCVSFCAPWIANNIQMPSSLISIGHTQCCAEQTQYSTCPCSQTRTHSNVNRDATRRRHSAQFACAYGIILSNPTLSNIWCGGFKVGRAESGRRYTGIGTVSRSHPPGPGPAVARPLRFYQYAASTAPPVGRRQYPPGLECARSVPRDNTAFTPSKYFFLPQNKPSKFIQILFNNACRDATVRVAGRSPSRALIKYLT